jgi:hypothetical protein
MYLRNLLFNGERATDPIHEESTEDTLDTIERLAAAAYV